jgi:hypothetical protein
MKKFFFFILLFAIARVLDLSFGFDTHLQCSWVAGAITAAGLLGGGLLSNKSTNNTNNTNLQIARENNALQYRIMQEQNQFNLNQWNATNAYNTPTAQRQRYEDAGINPYMALSSMSNGNVQSQLDAAPAPNLVTPHLEAPQGFANGVSQAAIQAANTYAQIAQAKKTQAETTGQTIQNSFMSAQKILELENMRKTIHSTAVKTEIDQMSRDLLKATFQNHIELSDMSVKQAGADYQKTQSETKLVDAQTTYQGTLIQLGIKQGSQIDQEIQLAAKRWIQDQKESNSRIALNSHQAAAADASANAANAAANVSKHTVGLVDANKRDALAKAIGQELDNAGKPHTKAQCDALAAAAVEQAQAQAIKTDREAYQSDVPDMSHAAGWIAKQIGEGLNMGYHKVSHAVKSFNYSKAARKFIKHTTFYGHSYTAPSHYPAGAGPNMPYNGR